VELFFPKSFHFCHAFELKKAASTVQISGRVDDFDSLSRSFQPFASLSLEQQLPSPRRHDIDEAIQRRSTRRSCGAQTKVCIIGVLSVHSA
jgi:hypothetical protein